MPGITTHPTTYYTHRIRYIYKKHYPRIRIEIYVNLQQSSCYVLFVMR